MIVGFTKYIAMIDDVNFGKGVKEMGRVEAMMKRKERVDKLRKSKKGKFKVIGVDKYDGEDWVSGEFDTAEEAIEYAEEKARESQRYASDPSVATVYYAYDPDGEYLGGEVP